MGASDRKVIELRPIGRVSSPLGDIASAPRQGDEGGTRLRVVDVKPVLGPVEER